MEVEVVEAAELETSGLNTKALVVDCTCEDEAGEDGFVAAGRCASCMGRRQPLAGLLHGRNDI